MSSVQVAEAKTRERKPLNGVDTPRLFATINVVKAQPELAKFQFRATNRWIKGTHSVSRIETFSGAGGEHRHTGEVEFNADHPAVLVGADAAPTPVEFLLHAIAACITSGMKERGLRLNGEWIYVRKSPVGYTAYPMPVGANGNVFHINLEMNF